MNLGLLRFSSLVVFGTIAVVAVLPSQAQMSKTQSYQQAQEQLQQYSIGISTVSARGGSSSSTPCRRRC